jgi:hypothetical protein
MVRGRQACTQRGACGLYGVFGQRRARLTGVRCQPA